MSEQVHNPFHHWVRLEQPRLGTRVVYATDDFFAAKERLIEPADPVFVADKYDDHGKWMDGWESRRKREPGHDYCIVRLGIPGVVRGLDINTRFFTGNYPPAASVDACLSDQDIPEAGWRELVPQRTLAGDSHHYLPIDDDRRISHLRLNIYPDGGVARMRIYGEVMPDNDKLEPGRTIDLLALQNGGRALLCNDEHFGSMHNLNLAGRGINMGDGWETARRREPGNDWVILALACPGIVESVEIDTAHFKGNYPDRAAIQAKLVVDADRGQLELQSRDWPFLLPESKLEMDRQQRFDSELADIGPVSHIRLSIYPDGGVSRLRIFGRPAAGSG